MKKTALGVRGMKLADDDYLEHAYLLAGHQEYTISYHDKEYALNLSLIHILKFFEEVFGIRLVLKRKRRA